MHRSFWLRLVLALAVIVTPLVAAPALSPDAAAAEIRTPNANADMEIIVLESSGRIRVDDPYVPTGVQQVVWNSGADIGWSLVAAGDFNGDGDAEIVAAQSTTIKVFDPVVPAGAQAAYFLQNLGAGRTVQQLVTGDFDGDGKDEIAVSFADSGTGVLSSLRVYDGGATATAAEWTQWYTASYNAVWQDIAVGNFNNDAYDDLALVRNVDNRIMTLAGGATGLSVLATQGNYATEWLAVAGGNIFASYPGDEIALERNSVNAQTNALILARVAGTALVDIGGGVNYKYNPNFTSLALGDLNGDGDDEILLLRDSVDIRTSLLMINPSGVAMREIQLAIGAGAQAFKLVRTGDIDGDGRAEIVVLRGDRYRVYHQPELSDSYLPDTLGSFRVTVKPSNVPTMAVADVDGPVRGPTLGVTPQSLTFNLEYSQPSPTQTVNIANSGTPGALAWQAQVVEGADWLRLNASSGVTPATLGVSVDTTGAAPGAYTGKIRISATDSGVYNTPQDVTVTLNLTGVALSVTPTDLSFTVEYGQLASPQNISIRSAGGSGAINWLADVLLGQEWLVLNASQGTTPSTLRVTVNAVAAGPGIHDGTIRIRTLDPQVADPIQYVTVRLTVPDPGFVVTPSELMILQETAGPVVTRNVSIWRPGGSVDWMATPVPGQSFAALAARLQAGEAVITADGVFVGDDGLEAVDWLVFTPTSGTTQPNTPTIMTVSIKPGTAPGKYTAYIAITAPDFPLQTVKVIGIVADQIPRVYLPIVKQ